MRVHNSLPRVPLANVILIGDRLEVDCGIQPRIVLVAVRRDDLENGTRKRFSNLGRKDRLGRGRAGRRNR
jgi:hypothetical protein